MSAQEPCKSAVEPLPPLGPPNDTQRTCSRLVGVVEGREILCGKPATEHVVYWWESPPTTGTGFDHGYCCAEHWTDYQRRWACAGHHAINGACGMPGSRIYPDRPCFFDDLPTAEPQRTLAVAREVAHA